MSSYKSAPSPFLSRLNNTLFNGGIRENIFYLHVPKCGGRSIETANKRCFITLDVRKDRFLIRHNSQAAARAAHVLYGSDYTHGTTADDYEEVRLAEEQLAYYMSLKSVRYISGHVTFNEAIYKAFGDRFKYVTVIRHPVRRWVSHYFYVRYRESDRGIINDDLIDYLKTDRAKSIGHHYVKYLGGGREDSDYRSDEAVESAKANLHKLEVVGFLENLDGFVESFKKRFGVTLAIGAKNQSPASNKLRENEMTEEAMEMIQEICRPDLEIYNYAKENFWVTPGTDNE